MVKIPEKLVNKYLDDEEITEATSSIGKNRGQYFVRIPSKISKRLHLDEKNKIRFIISGKSKKVKLKVEVVKNEKS